MASHRQSTPSTTHGVLTVALRLSAVLVLSAAGSSGAGSAATFPESRLITPDQGALLNSWANHTGQEWALCYTSFTMDKIHPAEFHKRCDQFNTTMVVGHTSGGRKFRCQGIRDYPDNTTGVTCEPIGYVGVYWNCDAKCGGPDPLTWYDCDHDVIGTPCGPTDLVNFTFGGYADATWGGNIPGQEERGTNATFLFGLEPQEKRFGQKTPKDPYAPFQWAYPGNWPQWGRGTGGDLVFGCGDIDSDNCPSTGGGPLGNNGKCSNSLTYTNKDGELCGGDLIWGETEMEVWRLVTSEDRN